MSLPTESDPTIRSIDRPLGLARADRKRRPSAIRTGLAGQGIPVLLALVLLGGSVWTASHRDPLRAPEAAQSLTGQSAVPPVPAQADAAVVENEAPQTRPTVTSPGTRIDDGRGPAIIRVTPNDDRLPDLPDGTSPADVEGAVVIRDPSALSQPMQLSTRPKPALVEQSPQGPLPKIGPDGERPFDAYRRPARPIDGPAIAIVVGGLGLSQTGTQQAIQSLPGEVTFAFAPTGNSLSRWQEAARRTGHELLLQLPMEPFGYPNTSPGPGTLLADAPAAETVALARKTLGRLGNYVGVLNYMGGRFLTEKQALQPVMAEIAGRGLMFVDDGTAPASHAQRLAAQEGAPFAMAGDAVDAIRDPEAIRRALAALEARAKTGRPVIATASAFRMTIDELARWMDEASDRGIRFVPVSALATDNR